MSKTNKVSFPSQGLFYWMEEYWWGPRANFIITRHHSRHHNTQKPGEQGLVIVGQDDAEATTIQPILMILHKSV